MGDGRTCPDLAEYRKLTAGALPTARREPLLRHLYSCAACARAVQTIGDADVWAELFRQVRRPESAESPKIVSPPVHPARRLPAADSSRDDDQALRTMECPSCGKRSRCRVTQAGKRVRCPHCGAAITVPAAGPTSAPVSTMGSESLARSDSVDAAPARAFAESEAKWRPLLSPAKTPEELGWLGPYRVLKILGAGGMGVVFQAEDPQLARLVALKAMQPSLAVSDEARQRFLREARAAAALKHDHIISIYQVGEDRGIPFLAMEYLQGESLADRLQRDGALPISEVIRRGREMALGLAAAHQRGLIHRDIKPANVWLDADTGRTKILDFGLARFTREPGQITQPGIILGTPGYMAPEQVHGRVVDARCDLFSLGCVLYLMATGQRPFHGDDGISTLLAVVNDHPRPPQEWRREIPSNLAQLILGLLEKDPGKRPATAQAVALALENCKAEESQPPLPATIAWPAARLRTRFRHPVRLLIAAGGAALLIVAVVWWGSGFFQGRDRTGLIVLANLPADAQVLVDGRPAEVTWRGTLAQLTLPPGTYHVQARKGDLELIGENVRLDAGSRRTVQAWRSPVAGTDDLKPGFSSAGERFESIFNGVNLAGWLIAPTDRAHWEVVDGAIRVTGLGWQNRTLLYSVRDYTDYAFRFEFQMDINATAAISLHAAPEVAGAKDLDGGILIQSDHTGALYWARDSTHLEPNPPIRTRPPSVWNQMEVRLHAGWLQVALNGTVVQLLHLDQIPNRPITCAGMKRRRGHLGLWAHTGTIRFRRLEVCDLSQTPPPAGLVKRLDSIVPQPAGPRALVVSGQWVHDDHTLSETDLKPNARILFGDPAWTDYDFSCEAMKRTGPDGFTLLFRAADPWNYYLFNVAVWQSRNHMAEVLTETGSGILRKINCSGFAAGRWYRVLVKVRGARLQCFLNEQLLFDLTDSSLPRGSVGFRTWDTAVSFRNIRITAPDGRVLFEGLPQLPDAQAP